MPSPSITVVVPSHDRPLRLRWLLNALELQTLPRAKWRVVVVHDDPGDETESLLATHPLTREGVLTHRRLEPGTGSPSVQRNTGWQAADSEVIAFIDDDCRPAPDWLKELHHVASSEPGAVVQGKTLPDPLEEALLRAPHHRTLEIDPPGPFGQTCNILYPSEVLTALGGFDERYPAPAGEDTDLFLRARAAGVPLVGATRAVVFHAVEAFSIFGMLRLNWKWQHLAYAARSHPEVREMLTLGMFWRPAHLQLLVAALALGVARRHPLAMLAVFPYFRFLMGRHGTRPRGRVRSVVEAPVHVVVDLGEVAACVRGSIRYRTFFL